MKKQEFFDALRRALSGLPMDERDNVMQYYEDYFLDAEGESEEEIIRGLGDPQKIADDILREYRELQPRPGAADAQASPRRRRGFLRGCCWCLCCSPSRSASRSRAACWPRFSGCLPLPWRSSWASPSCSSPSRQRCWQSARH